MFTSPYRHRLRVLSFFFCGFWQPAPDSSMSITVISRPDLQSAKQLETKQHEWLCVKEVKRDTQRRDLCFLSQLSQFSALCHQRTVKKYGMHSFQEVEHAAQRVVQFV